MFLFESHFVEMMIKKRAEKVEDVIFPLSSFCDRRI